MQDMADLPVDILLHVVSMLPADSFLRLIATCSRIRQMCEPQYTICRGILDITQSRTSKDAYREDMRIYAQSAICRHFSESIPQHPVLHVIKVKCLTMDVGCVPVPGHLLADMVVIKLVFSASARHHLRHVSRWTIPCVTSAIRIEGLRLTFHIQPGHRSIDLINVDMVKIRDKIYTSFGLVAVYDDHEDMVVEEIGMRRDNGMQVNIGDNATYTIFV